MSSARRMNNPKITRVEHHDLTLQDLDDISEESAYEERGVSNHNGFISGDKSSESMSLKREISSHEEG